MLLPHYHSEERSWIVELDVLVLVLVLVSLFGRWICPCEFPMSFDSFAFCWSAAFPWIVVGPDFPRLSASSLHINKCIVGELFLLNPNLDFYSLASNEKISSTRFRFLLVSMIWVTVVCYLVLSCLVNRIITFSYLNPSPSSHVLLPPSNLSSQCTTDISVVCN